LKSTAIDEVRNVIFTAFRQQTDEIAAFLSRSQFVILPPEEPWVVMLRSAQFRFFVSSDQLEALDQDRFLISVTILASFL